MEVFDGNLLIEQMNECTFQRAFRNYFMKWLGTPGLRGGKYYFYLKNAYYSDLSC